MRGSHPSRADITTTLSSDSGAESTIFIDTLVSVCNAFLMEPPLPIKLPTLSNRYNNLNTISYSIPILWWFPILSWPETDNDHFSNVWLLFYIFPITSTSAKIEQICQNMWLRREKIALSVKLLFYILPVTYFILCYILL